MSAFSDKNFKSDSYSSYRPTYNKEFFDLIFQKYYLQHGSLALDIGCGTGQVTRELSSHFDQTIGTDLSPKMIQTAKEKNKDASISYQVSGAESLPFLESGSVDLVTCGQLCHWFDHEKWFQEMHRILHKDGLLVYFGYSDPFFPQESEEVNALLDDISYGDDWFGPYWEQPGRNLVRDLLRKVDQRLPSDKFELLTTSKFDGSSTGQKESALHIERDLKLGDYINYITTWSSVHNYHAQNSQVVGTPEDLFEKILPLFKSRFGWDLNKPVKVVWKTCYTIAKKI